MIHAASGSRHCEKGDEAQGQSAPPVKMRETKKKVVTTASTLRTRRRKFNR